MAAAAPAAAIAGAKRERESESERREKLVRIKLFNKDARPAERGKER